MFLSTHDVNKNRTMGKRLASLHFPFRSTENTGNIKSRPSNWSDQFTARLLHTIFHDIGSEKAVVSKRGQLVNDAATAVLLFTTTAMPIFLSGTDRSVIVRACQK